MKILKEITIFLFSLFLSLSSAVGAILNIASLTAITHYMEYDSHIYSFGQAFSPDRIMLMVIVFVITIILVFYMIPYFNVDRKYWITTPGEAIKFYWDLIRFTIGY